MQDNPKPKKITRSDGLLKMMRYCAYQIRCQQEVRDKLYAMGFRTADVESIIAELIVLDMLNEERFARSFARGKFRIKNWGKNKIRSELKRYQISDYLIEVGLTEINEAEYTDTMLRLIAKEGYTPDKFKNYKLRYRITQKLLGKGFELDRIQECFNLLS